MYTRSRETSSRADNLRLHEVGEARVSGLCYRGGCAARKPFDKGAEWVVGLATSRDVLGYLLGRCPWTLVENLGGGVIALPIAVSRANDCHCHLHIPLSGHKHVFPQFLVDDVSLAARGLP